MIDERNDEVEGVMELSHEPVAPYRAVFVVTIAVGVFYLGFILFMTL